jgi:hypothetical protein
MTPKKIAFIRKLEKHGHIAVDDVIDAARPAKSPIHDEFEWDKDKAWYQQAVAVAERLIRAVKVNVRVERRSITAVAYVRDPDSREAGNYIALTTAARSRQKAFKILQEEMGRVKGAIRRAREVAAVLGLSDELEEMMADADRIMKLGAEANGYEEEEARN